MINMDPLRMNMAYFRNKHNLLLPQNEQMNLTVFVYTIQSYIYIIYHVNVIS